MKEPAGREGIKEQSETEHPGVDLLELPNIGALIDEGEGGVLGKVPVWEVIREGDHGKGGRRRHQMRVQYSL